MTEIQEGDIVTAKGFVRKLAVLDGVKRALVFSSKGTEDMRSIWIDADILDLEERPIKFEFGDQYAYTVNGAEVFRVTYVIDDNWLDSSHVRINRKNKTVETTDTGTLTASLGFPLGDGWVKV